MRILNGPPKAPAIPYRMEKKEKSADVYLYDIIGDSWDGTTAKQFAKDMKALGEFDTLNIFINSPGGSVFDGVAIYNQLTRINARKVVHIDGMAASIASVVAMAGDERRIAKNGMIMIHDAWAMAFVMGTAQEFRDFGNYTGDKLEKITATILQTYVDRSTTDEKTLRAWMKEEKWLTADEALAAGLVDAISEAEVEMAAMSKHDLTSFKKVPEILKAAAKPPAEPEEPFVAKPHPALVRAEMRLLRHKPGPALS